MVAGSSLCESNRRCKHVICLWRVYIHAIYDGDITNAVQSRLEYVARLLSKTFHHHPNPLNSTIGTNVWNMMLTMCPLGAFRASMVYYAETQALYVFGGMQYAAVGNMYAEELNPYVYQYHIPSNLWFSVGTPMQYTQARNYFTATMIPDGALSGYIAFVGGTHTMTYVQDGNDQCYFDYIVLYDLGK